MDRQPRWRGRAARWRWARGAVLAVAISLVIPAGCGEGSIAPDRSTESSLRTTGTGATTGTSGATATTSTTVTTPAGTTVITPAGTRSGTPASTRSSTRSGSTRPSPTSTAPPASTMPAALAPVDLAGVNEPDCHSQDPPVVLLHGSFASVRLTFSAIAPVLAAGGRCLYGLDYGHGGIDAVAESAAAVADFVRKVLAVTGAGRVDVVAYSQGGLVLRTALRLDGLADLVRVAVLIAPSFHGTTAPIAAAVPAALCPACADQAAGSALLQRLDAGGDLDGDVRYAVISTQLDTIVTPVSSQVPIGPPDRVRSLVVQDLCPDARPDHVSLPGYPGLARWILAALEHDGRPAPSALTCG